MKPTDVALHYLGGLRKALAQQNTHKLKSSKMAVTMTPDSELGTGEQSDGMDGMDESDLASILHESMPGDATEDAMEGDLSGGDMDQATEGEMPEDPKLKKKHLTLTKG